MSDQQNIDLYNLIDSHVEPGYNVGLSLDITELTDAVLDAGYRKMTPVESVEQLKALPTGSVVLDIDGSVTVAYSKTSTFFDDWLAVPGRARSVGSEFIFAKGGKLVVAFAPEVSA